MTNKAHRIYTLQIMLFFALVVLSLVVPQRVLTEFEIPILLFIVAPLVGLFTWSQIAAAREENKESGQPNRSLDRCGDASQRDVI